MEEKPNDNFFWQMARECFPVCCDIYGTRRVAIMLNMFDLMNIDPDMEANIFCEFFPLTDEEEIKQQEMIAQMDIAWKLLNPEEAKNAESAVQKAIEKIMNGGLS